MIEFDGIGFEDTNSLIEFLKHSYFAHKSRIATLEQALQELKSPGQATAERLDRLWRRLLIEIQCISCGGTVQGGGNICEACARDAGRFE